MSSVANVAYEQSFIPCAHPGASQSLERGVASVNVDGKPVYGGVRVNGVTYTGGVSTANHGYLTASLNKQTAAAMATPHGAASVAARAAESAQNGVANGNEQLFYLGGFQGTPYSTNRNTVSSNSQAGRFAGQTHL